MKFYHGTTEENYKKILLEGILWGRRSHLGTELSRCTYLTDNKAEAQCYGKILLEVEYDPFKNPNKNNYIPGCWQFRVYEPIPLDNVKVIDIF